MGKWTALAKSPLNATGAHGLQRAASTPRPNAKRGAVSLGVRGGPASGASAAKGTAGRQRSKLIIEGWINGQEIVYAEAADSGCSSYGCITIQHMS